MEGRWANLPQELRVIKDRWLGASCEDTLPMVDEESPGCSGGAILMPLSVPLSVTVTRQGQHQKQLERLEQLDGLGDTPTLLPGGDDVGDGPGTSRVSMSTDSLDGSQANASDEVIFPRSPSGRPIATDRPAAIGRPIARRDCPDCPAGDGGRHVESRQGLNVIVGTHHQSAAADEMTEQGRTGESESEEGGAGVISTETHSEDQWGARHEPAPAYGDAVVRAPNKLTQGNARRSEAVQGTPTSPCARTPRVLHVGVAVTPPIRARRRDILETTPSLPASQPPINTDSPTNEVAKDMSIPASHGYTSHTSLSADTTQTSVASIKGEWGAEEDSIATPEGCARVLQGSKRQAARASARSGEVSPELEQLVPLTERVKESPPAIDRNRNMNEGVDVKRCERCERCIKCVKDHAGDVGHHDQIHHDERHHYKAHHDGSPIQRPSGVFRKRPPGWDLTTTSTTPVQPVLNAARSRKVEDASVAKPPRAKPVAAASVPGDLTTLLTPVTEVTEAVTAEDRSAASCGTRGTARNTPSSTSASASPGTRSSGQGQASASPASGAMVGVGRRDRRGTVVVVDHQKHYNRRRPDHSPAVDNPRRETHCQGRHTSDGGNRNSNYNRHRAMWSCGAVDSNGDSSRDINDDSNHDSAVDSAVDSAANGSGIERRRRRRKGYGNYSSQDLRSISLERRSPLAIVAAVAVQDGSGPTISTFSSRSAATSYREPRVCGSGSGNSGIGNGIGSVNSSGNGSGGSYLAAMGRRSRCSARYETVRRLSEMARAVRATTASPAPIAMAERARWGKGRETPKEAERRNLLQRRAEYACEVKRKTLEVFQAQAARPPPSKEKQTLGSSEVPREDYDDTRHCSPNTTYTTSLEAAGLARENAQCAVGSNNNNVRAAGMSGLLGHGRGHLDGRTSESGNPPFPCETLPQTTVARTARAPCLKRPDGVAASSDGDDDDDGKGPNAGYEACRGGIQNRKAKARGTSKSTSHDTGRGNCRGFSSDPGQKGRVGSMSRVTEVKQAVRATEAPGEEERLVESIARLNDLLQEGPGPGHHDARDHPPNSLPRRKSYFPPDRSAEVRGVGGMRREPSITQMGSYKKPPHDEGVAKTRVRTRGGKSTTRSALTPAAARLVDDDGGISPTREVTTSVAQAPGVLAAGGGGSTRTALTKFPPLFSGLRCPRYRRGEGSCLAEGVNWPRSSHHPESRRTPPIPPTPEIPGVCASRHPSRTTPPAGRRPHNGSDRGSLYDHEHLRARRRCRSPPSQIYECHHECTADIAENDRYNDRWGSGWNGGRDRYQRRYPDGCRYPARGERDCNWNQQSSPRPVLQPTGYGDPRHEMSGGVSYSQGVEGVEGDEYEYPTRGVGYHQSVWSERQLDRGSWTQAPGEEQGFDDGRCAGYPIPTQWDRRDGGQHVLRAPVGYVY